MNQAYPQSNYAECAKSPAISAQGRLEALDDRLVKLMASIDSALGCIANNADRVLGCQPPTPATLSGSNRVEPAPDTAIGRLFDRVSALTALAEALNSQAHRFDSL